MPTYTYKCSSCKIVSEAFQRISEAPLTHCPACKQESLARIPSAGLGFVLNGSGWYESDYKKECCPCGKQSDASETSACPNAQSPSE